MDEKIRDFVLGVIFGIASALFFIILVILGIFPQGHPSKGDCKPIEDSSTGGEYGKGFIVYECKDFRAGNEFRWTLDKQE